MPSSQSSSSSAAMVSQEAAERKRKGRRARSQWLQEDLAEERRLRQAQQESTLQVNIRDNLPEAEIEAVKSVEKPITQRYQDIVVNTTSNGSNIGRGETQVYPSQHIGHPEDTQEKTHESPGDEITGGLFEVSKKQEPTAVACATSRVAFSSTEAGSEQSVELDDGMANAVEANTSAVSMEESEMVDSTIRATREQSKSSSDLTPLASELGGVDLPDSSQVEAVPQDLEALQANEADGNSVILTPKQCGQLGNKEALLQEKSSSGMVPCELKSASIPEIASTMPTLLKEPMAATSSRALIDGAVARPPPSRPNASSQEKAASLTCPDVTGDRSRSETVTRPVSIALALASSSSRDKDPNWVRSWAEQQHRGIKRQLSQSGPAPKRNKVGDVGDESPEHEPGLPKAASPPPFSSGSETVQHHNPRTVRGEVRIDELDNSEASFESRPRSRKNSVASSAFEMIAHDKPKPQTVLGEVRIDELDDESEASFRIISPPPPDISDKPGNSRMSRSGTDRSPGSILPKSTTSAEVVKHPGSNSVSKGRTDRPPIIPIRIKRPQGYTGIRQGNMDISRLIHSGTHTGRQGEPTSETSAKVLSTPVDQTERPLPRIRVVGALGGIGKRMGLTARATSPPAVKRAKGKGRDTGATERDEMVKQRERVAGAADPFAAEGNPQAKKRDEFDGGRMSGRNRKDGNKTSTSKGAAHLAVTAEGSKDNEKEKAKRNRPTSGPSQPRPSSTPTSKKGKKRDEPAIPTRPPPAVTAKRLGGNRLIITAFPSTKNTPASPRRK